MKYSKRRFTKRFKTRSKHSLRKYTRNTRVIKSTKIRKRNTKIIRYTRKKGHTRRKLNSLKKTYTKKKFSYFNKITRKKYRKTNKCQIIKNKLKKLINTKQFYRRTRKFFTRKKKKFFTRRKKNCQNTGYYYKNKIKIKQNHYLNTSTKKLFINYSTISSKSEHSQLSSDYSYCSDWFF